ncbi:hypothetical protein Tsubulata_012489 [Turnera subulata]|uniref:DUF4283 domain-containing protein n=1 Tax=Turnera subulata TaxID=218843 RepID=A0A9Q0JRE7_9ROSI|nr:hypothetical protein Tsubulata_012489 [Turnera subulata]
MQAAPRPIPKTMRKGDRSYAEAVEKRDGQAMDEHHETQTGESIFIPTSDTIAWLSRCAVEVLKDPKHMESALLVWKAHGLGDVEVSELGGDTILACFPSKEDMTQFLSVMPEWITLWFQSMEPWRHGIRAENRRCWLSLRGVPLNAWCNEFFAMIGSFFGQLLQVAPDTERRKCLDGACIQVLTTRGDVINKCLEFKVGGQDYKIDVVELCHPVTSGRLIPGVLSESDQDPSEESSEDEDGGHDYSEQEVDQKSTPEITGDPYQLMPIITRIERGPQCEACIQTPDALRKESQEFNADIIPKERGQSAYVQYLEQRLAQAIRAARVTQRRRFRKITAKGSIVSSDSSTNNDIRRMNMRLSVAKVRPSPVVSFTEQEARETVDMGNLMGWEGSNNQPQLVLLAKNLVEKEAVEWSKSRAND